MSKTININLTVPSFKLPKLPKVTVTLPPKVQSAITKTKEEVLLARVKLAVKIMPQDLV
jgi:hypothetical protein